MRRIRSEYIIYKALAMREETKEQIRRNAMRRFGGLPRGFKLSRVWAAALSVLLVIVIGAGGYFVFTSFIFGSGGGIDETTSASAAPQDSDVSVYVMSGSQMLGNLSIETAARIVDANGSFIQIWLGPLTTITTNTTDASVNAIPQPTTYASTTYPSQIQTGQASDTTTESPTIDNSELPPKLTIVFDDGTEISPATNYGATWTTMSYTFLDTVGANSFHLKDDSGHEIEITLTPLRSAKLSVHKFDNASVTVISLPVPGKTDFVEAEFIDPLTLDISKYAASININTQLAIPDTESSTQYIFGIPYLSGYTFPPLITPLSMSATPVNIGCDGFNTLNYVSVGASFMSGTVGDANNNQVYGNVGGYLWDNTANQTAGRACTLTVPKVGQTINCDVTLFDADDIQFKITSVANQDGNLIVTTNTTDPGALSNTLSPIAKIDNPDSHRTRAQFNCSLGIYSPLPDGAVPVNGVTAYFQNFGYNYVVPNPYGGPNVGTITVQNVPLKPGDEFVCNLDSLNYSYIGTINLQ